MAAKKLEHPALEQLAATPEILRLMMMGVSEEQAQVRPAPERWSIAEVLEHLSHVESHSFRARLDRMIAENNPKLEPYDQEAYAEAGTYSGREAEESFAHWEEQRESNLEMLEGLHEGVLARVGTHGELGPITVENMLNQWAMHDLGHVRQIADLVRAQLYYPGLGPFQKYHPV